MRVLDKVLATAEQAEDRYGKFTSTHEALGVLFEEWDELIDAIRRNDLEDARDEAVDLAAVAMRLAEQCQQPSAAFRERSGA